MPQLGWPLVTASTRVTVWFALRLTWQVRMRWSSDAPRNDQTEALAG